MKKIVSSILVCSTLFVNFNHIGYCYEKTSIKIKAHPKKIIYKLNDSDTNALKDTILKLSKDKEFTTKLEKNYKKTHEDSFSQKCFKKFLKIVLFPINATWYILKKAFDYTIGKKAADFIENTIIPTAIATLTGMAAYKKVAWFKNSVNWILDHMSLYNKYFTSDGYFENGTN